MASSDMCDNEIQCKVLEYKIYKCSSTSLAYLPENILVDKPQDQTSRWSSDHDHHPQYLALKLRQPAIIKTITFGKYEKTHVCNMKKFKIFAGMEYENMTEILRGGLKNDTIAETFEIKYRVGTDKIFYPVRYIKIMPIQSWGPNFNFTIWYVRLMGNDDPAIVGPCINWMNQYIHNEILRLCMKHFRRLEHPKIVQTLGQVANIKLEDQRLSILYNILVNNGDYLEAENFLTNTMSSELLNDYINSQPYRAEWTKVICDDPKPGMRGGHQMVIDSAGETLYLFGGWGGHQDLSDLWSYNIKTGKWSLICKDTEKVGGPGTRSCHKMCLDPVRRQLFILGRYLDPQYRTVENLKSSFYVYDIESNKWTQISEDTSAVGGPKLIFDHQMCIDIKSRMIYVFGGRILGPSTSSIEDQNMSISPIEPVFSGLYSYHVPTNTWKLLACDIARSNLPDDPVIRSRVGHSMLFHPVDRKLYIFAGQRNKEYLNDFFTYQVDTNKIEQINISDFENNNPNDIPAAGYTQRATIDPTLSEIYVLSGMNKNKDKHDDNVKNSFWVYRIKKNLWTCIHRNENISEKYWNKMQDSEPCPRFAHQLVYDSVEKVHYLFGGNPGRSWLPKLRLDDFWKLHLCRPTHKQILQKCKLLIRKYKFKELALSSTIEALEYLQKDVSEIIDHNDRNQTKDFQLLASDLFGETYSSSYIDRVSNESSSSSIDSNTMMHDLHERRTELFDKLMEFYPERLTQPRANLIDLLPL
ncbi:hypothetical protein PV325_004143 [Microctonus aethiopoides]|uniref:Muskelin N-terminal domain-containing protein n=1 Tax=Microctonus aethiopoides TaxID=144406 RepID=A0AA39EYZ8_9HYME|nr:hypothetical protein PV325_004143 [Microctonus aethiopoides]KAK0158116.1 hypothetical protein PV328_009161 [Microctonus aethiopoides]